MPLVAGSRLGPYEVTAAIGAGGMGGVYRARDTKLNRNVAERGPGAVPSGLVSEPSLPSTFKPV